MLFRSYIQLWKWFLSYYFYVLNSKMCHYWSTRTDIFPISISSALSFFTLITCKWVHVSGQVFHHKLNTKNNQLITCELLTRFRKFFKNKIWSGMFHLLCWSVLVPASIFNLIIIVNVFPLQHNLFCSFSGNGKIRSNKKSIKSSARFDWTVKCDARSTESTHTSCENAFFNDG